MEVRIKMENIIKELRRAYKECENDKNEANIKEHVIVRCFLEGYGYDVSKCQFEKKIGNGYCDIWYQLEENKGIVIEVKRGDLPIDTEHIRQVMNYAKNKNIKFAILSNGHEFLLLDFNYLPPETIVEDEVPMSYVVFWFDIFKVKGSNVTPLQYFKYMSYQNIVVSQLSKYFCDIARYRVWKLSEGMKQESWRAYQSTLFRFFDFYGAIRKKYNSNYYSQIDKDFFDEYIMKCKRKGDKTSNQTLANNHTHINDFLVKMKEHNEIPYIGLEGRKQSLAEYAIIQGRNQITEIMEDDILDAIGYFKTTRKPTRNILMFLLSVSTGIGRMQLGKLRWGDIGKDCRYMMINEKKIVLPSLIQNYLKKLDSEIRQRKSKLDYVFQTYHKKKYKAFAQSSSNDIFAGLSKHDSRWKGYSLQHMRNYLIPYLFQKGFSLDQIIYITGIDINNVFRYISTIDIIEREKKASKGNVDWSKLYDGILNDENV